MNTLLFEKVRYKIQESMNPKIYEDDYVVDGLFNTTEALILQIVEPENKETFIRMFRGIKERTRTFNNNHKLSALDSLYDTIINTNPTGGTSMNTTLIIERDADMFVQEYSGNPSATERWDNSDYRGRLENRLRQHDKPENKLLFLRRVESEIDKLKSEHLETCRMVGDKEKCAETMFYSGMKYFTQQVSDKLTITNQSPEYFTVEEKAEQTSKIDEVLAKLNELQLGQEIIYDDIEELKNLPNLKKKNFNEVVKGKIVDWGLKKEAVK